MLNTNKRNKFKYSRTDCLLFLKSEKIHYRKTSASWTPRVNFVDLCKQVPNEVILCREDWIMNFSHENLITGRTKREFAENRQGFSWCPSEKLSSSGRPAKIFIRPAARKTVPGKYNRINNSNFTLRLWGWGLRGRNEGKHKERELELYLWTFDGWKFAKNSSRIFIDFLHILGGAKNLHGLFSNHWRFRSEFVSLFYYFLSKLRHYFQKV